MGVPAGIFIHSITRSLFACWYKVLAGGTLSVIDVCWGCGMVFTGWIESHDLFQEVLEVRELVNLWVVRIRTC